MKQILIENISDSDHARIHDALTKAYATETCEEAIAAIIKQTVKNVEEVEIIKAKEAEAEAEREAIDEIAI